MKMDPEDDVAPVGPAPNPALGRGQVMPVQQPVDPAGQQGQEAEDSGASSPEPDGPQQRFVRAPTR